MYSLKQKKPQRHGDPVELENRSNLKIAFATLGNESHQSMKKTKQKRQRHLKVNIQKNVLSGEFLDPRLWPEGSYELGSVRPSILPSFCLKVFLGLAHFHHGVRGPCAAVRDRARFFEEKKKKLPQKWGKWNKNRVF